MVFLVFVASRLLIFFCAFIAQRTVPYLGFFPYKEVLVDYGLPSWLSSFASFDGIHYLLIARQGYSQWEQAFFPLYPLCIRALTFFIPNYLVASLVVSNVSFLIGTIFFIKLIKKWGIKSISPLIFLLAFPTAFYFGVVYTEGLFFLLLVLSLYFLNKKNYLVSGLFAILSSSTRLIGAFLIIPFFFSLLTEKKITIRYIFQRIHKHIFLLFSPFIGLISYMGYLFITTGDPLFFFHSQPVFGANRSTHLILFPQVYFRYLKILFLAQHNFQWYLSVFEMSIFSLVLIVLVLDLIQCFKRLTIPSLRKTQGQNVPNYMSLGINIFSFANLILPTLTGTFSSIPRYVLFSLSFFLYLGQIKSWKIKVGILTLFITFQIILLSLFIQGYFVG
jgi:hypothetical protein